MENWTKLEISKIGKVVSGGTPDTNNSDFWDGNVDWCTPTDITALKTRFLGKTKRKLTEKGLKKSSATILPIGSIIVCTRATIGECAINTVEMTTNQGFKNIIPKDNFNSDFIYYSIVLNKSKLVRLSAGSTFGEVSKTAFEKLKLGIPPLGEQKKIAEILSIWDKAVETTEKLIAVKQKLKKSLMQRLLTGSQRFPEFHGQEWEILKISDFTKQAIRVKNKPDKPFLAMGIRSHGKGTFLKPDFEPSKIDMTELYEVKENDLIVNITFAWEGAIAIVGKNDEGALVSHRFPTYEFQTERMIPEFFRYVIRQKEFIERLGIISPGGAGRNRVLSKKDFVKLEVKIPKVEEQKKIAAVLNSCDAEINVLQSKLAALRQQKRGLMQKLLTGRVRVKVEESGD